MNTQQPHLVILHDETGNPTCYLVPDRETALAHIKAHALQLFEEADDPEAAAALELTEDSNGRLRAVADYTGYAQPWLMSLDTMSSAFDPCADLPNAIRESILDRAACGGWNPPRTAGEWLAWILDESLVQIEQAAAALDAEERQVRVNYIAQCNASAEGLLDAGVSPARLPWEDHANGIYLEWQDGRSPKAKAQPAIKVKVKTDMSGMTVTFFDAHGEPLDGEVLIECYAGAITVHAWNVEDDGGDPTASTTVVTLNDAEAYIKQVSHDRPHD